MLQAKMKVTLKPLTTYSNKLSKELHLRKHQLPHGLFPLPPHGTVCGLGQEDQHRSEGHLIAKGTPNEGSCICSFMDPGAGGWGEGLGVEKHG